MFMRNGTRRIHYSIYSFTYSASLQLMRQAIRPSATVITIIGG